MSEITPLSSPEPDPDDEADLISGIEAHLAADAARRSSGETGEVAGMTRRVRNMTRQVDESHRLEELQADPIPLDVDDARTWRKRRKVAQAGKRWKIDQDPRALLYRDQRIRRITTAMTMTAAGIALSISAIGVQDSVAKGTHLVKHTAVWWAAFGVEPAMSLPLLSVVGVQAYSAMRGRVIERKSEAGKRMFRTEAVLLGLTLLLNIWPALPGLRDEGAVLPLVVHMLGPIAAVVAVWTLPTIWAVLGALTAPGDTTADLRWNTAEHPAERPARGRNEAEHRAELRHLIAEGVLSATPNATDIQRTLKCRRDVAIRLRNELTNDKKGS